MRLAGKQGDDESVSEWERRRNTTYRQLAPLVDRVGRLMGDVGALLQFVGDGGTIAVEEASEQAAVVLPEAPRGVLPDSAGDPREGMNALVRSGLGAGDAVIVMNGMIQGNTVVVPIDDNLMQTDVMRVLEQVFEDMAERVPHGRRPGESREEAMERRMMELDEARERRRREEEEVVEEEEEENASSGRCVSVYRLQCCRRVCWTNRANANNHHCCMDVCGL